VKFWEGKIYFRNGKSGTEEDEVTRLINISINNLSGPHKCDVMRVEV